MASVNHVDSSKNPYHYSFSLCASGNFLPTCNYNANERVTPSNKTYFSYEARYDPKPLFNCDLCDRAFKTEVQYKRHVSEHVTCGKDGCEFTAHPKVVAVHFRTQHETGVFHLIKKLNAPEEVKKWIEERKRKYPTQQNIQNQKRVEEDKIRRGEVIKRDNGRFNKNFGKRRERKCPQEKHNKKHKPNHSNIRPKVTPKCVTTENVVKEVVKDECNGGVPAFQGLGCNDEKGKTVVKAVTEETTQQIPPVKKDPSLLVNKSLALLMTSYDSGTETDEEPSVSAPKKQENSDSDSSPEEVKTVKKPASPENEISTECSTRKRQFKRTNRPCPKRRKTGSKIIPQTRPRKQTLLEKLLHDEVVNERQLIFSSLRCIVRNNFFETGIKKRTPVLPKKSSLLEGLLKDEIINERNMILQCIRQIVNNHFFD